MEHGTQSLRQFLGQWHFVGNRRLANLCLGAHNALRQRTRSDEEAACYLLGCQPAHLTQGERNARFRRESWMTARKNQTQAIILNGIFKAIVKAVLFIGLFRRIHLRFEIVREFVLRRVEPCSSTQSVNGFEAGRRY
ncbi:MAG: hypothetical protein QOD75_2100, partial [Blastocatellia bacterium]|nr:hypothetical protein [Blastocatellia bacterium]